MDVIKVLLNSFVFWCAWIIIPVLMEIIPAIGSVGVLVWRRLKHLGGYPRPAIYPEISLIIPVYQSEDTLEGCLEAIYQSTYPTASIRIFLVNNESVDGSFDVYKRCQTRFPDLNMQWLNASQGKSRALNLALYNSNGKYIINMDSDGFIEPNALCNIVDKFEARPDLNCMTGTILTMPEKIKEYTGFFARLLRNLEFMEYAQAFLAGRSFASELNSVYTLSGAFSAFRKSAVLSSRLYNTDTICEDTQLTFQMRYLYRQRVEVCENAIFFTEPIENLNKLYTQRQRWQRGSLEVAQMFFDKNFRVLSAFKDVNVRTLLYDHTFAFPRLIWYLALICLMCMNNSSFTILLSTAIIFALYIIMGYFYFFSALSLLKMRPDVRKYYRNHWWVVALLPLFNLGVFFIRVAGVINSINTDSAWKTQNLTQERNELDRVLRSDVSRAGGILAKVRRVFNRRERKYAELSPTLPLSWYLVSGLLLFAAAALICSVYWVSSTYGIGLNELLNTMTGNLQGTSDDVIWAVVKGCAAPPLIILAVFLGLAAVDRLICRRRKVCGGRPPGTPVSRMLPLFCATLLLTAVLYANMKFDVLAYYMNQNSYTGIYDAYYVAPESVAITPGEQKKNLIYIYLESMETTYAVAEDGGVQNVNYIPQLTRLARENISFSNTELLGGFHTVTGAGYTMAAIFATTTGVPYALPVDTTLLAEADSFASGITGLGDILQAQGYNQEFLCGSDAVFGGRKLYFQQHGGYAIFDYYTAIEQEYIPADYYVWWGYEDTTLFEIAKNEAERLAAEDAPFNLTLLTVDLHHIAGYICGECGGAYASDTANVAACTDRQTSEFIEWCRQQPFFADTVIVITGDHPRMDTYLVDGVSYYDRTIYNCFINVDVDGELPAKNIYNREFTHMDIFPTVLAALGFSIEGERLGLGTNLFSAQPTLAEQLTFDFLNAEVAKSSLYYVETFAPELAGI